MSLAPPEAPAPAERRRRGGWRPVARVLGLVALVIVVVWVNEVAVDSTRVRTAVYEFGYPGLFAMAALSGFNLVVPVPIIAFFPFLMEAGLAPVPTVATIALGMTTGDMLGWLLGFASREAITPPAAVQRFMRWAERLRDRHRVAPYLALALYAGVVPLPNELLVIPMAFAGFRLPGIFAAALGGNLVFNTLAASGLVRLFDII